MTKDYSIKDFFKETRKEVGKLNEFMIKNNQGTIIDYLKKKSVEIDSYIIDQEKSDNITFVTGEISLNRFEDNDFYVAVDLYFKNRLGQFINKKIKGKPTRIEWEFTPEEQDKIINGGSLSFEYEKPVKEHKK